MKSGKLKIAGLISGMMMLLFLFLFYPAAPAEGRERGFSPNGYHRPYGPPPPVRLGPFRPYRHPYRAAYYHHRPYPRHTAGRYHRHDEPHYRAGNRGDRYRGR